MSDMSESIAELATALAKAQSEIKAAAKDRENPFFGSRYATLEAVWEACRGPLCAQGLAVVQLAAANADAVTVTTMLMHTSGQWIKSALSLVPRDASPQAAGSAITYARRYGLAAMVGVTPEEDDDGNAAQPMAPQARQVSRGRQFAKPPVVTAPPEEIGRPERPQTSPEEHEAEARALFPTPEEQAERALLIKDLKRLTVKLKLTDKDKQQVGNTYLGETVSAAEARLDDLTQLVDYLRARAQEPKWADRERAA